MDLRRKYIKISALEEFEEEMQFTKLKIQQNFSNFSAWHRRGIIIQAFCSKKNTETSLNSKIEVLETGKLLKLGFFVTLNFAFIL